MGREYDEFLRLLDTENRFFLKFMEILAKLAKGQEVGKNDMKLADSIVHINNEFKEHIANGGHCSAFVVNEADKNTIDEVCKKAEKMDVEENFSFDHCFIKNMTDENYTMVFKDTDYSNVNKMCKYLKDNEYDISFDYEKIDINQGFSNEFKDIAVSEIEVDIERPDLIDIVKENLSKTGIEFRIEEKEDTKGFIVATSDESKLKSMISMLPMDMEDKENIYRSYKRVNDREEAKEATKDLISTKRKSKNKDKEMEIE